MHYRDHENTFTYVQDILVDYIHPQEGPRSGGTKVSVRGIGFAPFKNDDGSEILTRPLYYRVLNSENQEEQLGQVTQVEDMKDDSFNWHTPPGPADSRRVLFQISWNKQNWQTILPLGKSYTFEYYDAPEVSAVKPRFGPVKSPNNEKVVIEGKNFVCPNNDCSKVTVRFGGPNNEVSIYMPGEVIDETHIGCYVPKFTKPDVLEVEISLDGYDYTHNHQTYGFFDAYLLDV